MLRKGDLFVIVVTVIAAACMLPLIFGKKADTGSLSVSVTCDGEEVQKVPLSENGTYRIQGADGICLTLSVKDGTAKVTDSECPDRLCMMQYGRSKAGQTIVCLPAKVIAEVVSDTGQKIKEEVSGGGEEDLDAVSY